MRPERKNAADHRPRASGVRLENGMRCFLWHGRYDPRGYVPPRAYEADAELIDHHPQTGKAFRESQWWIFLKRK